MNILSIVVLIALILISGFSYYTKFLKIGVQEDVNIESDRVPRSRRSEDLEDQKRRQKFLMEERQRKLREAQERYR